jgi:hypothetical protein
MKTFYRIFTLALMLFVIPCARGNIVGYYNTTFHIGDNLFASALMQGDNRLNTLFPAGSLAPVGTSISLWDAGANAYYETAVWDGQFWWDSGFQNLVNFELLPGTGAKLTTPGEFTQTFVGEVIQPEPPPFSGPNGVHLLGDKWPRAGGNVFLRVLGRGPNVGEQFINDAGVTWTFLQGGIWDLGSEPTLAVGEAAFFNIGPVPEPTTAALLLLAGGCLWARRRG